MNSGAQEQTVREADSKRPDRRRAWIYVASMMGCILLTLPTTPIIWRTALKIFGPSVNDVGYLLFLFIFAGIGFYAGKRFAGTNVRALSLLFVFALIYFCLLKYACQYPAERLHLVEYGALAYLLYRALRLDFSLPKAYIFGFLIASAFGIFDELMQGILDNRVYETRDVAINVISAGMCLLVVRTVIDPTGSPAADT